MANERTEKIESQHSNTPKKLLSFQSPLLDLPIPITEIILERLPLRDYIRFGSVCTKWYSIQKQHRIRYYPMPPPMQKSFPWLIRCSLTSKGYEILPFYSPFEQKYFSLKMPTSKYKLIPSDSIFSASASSLGWFFLVDNGHCKQISLFNPVSKSQINLPPLTTNVSNINGFLSASPLSPDCVVLILDCHYRAFLYWVGRKQSKWTSLDIPNGLDSDNYFGFDGLYYDGKFYCIAESLFVIDLGFTTPTANELDMDCSQLPSEDYVHNQTLVESNGKDYVHNHTLVESNGEILLVDLIYCRSYKRLEVFKADFSKLIWVRLKSIGDRALFVSPRGSFSVSANDMGCKSNCLYFIAMEDCFVEDRETWGVFDMDTMLWSSGPPSPCKENECKWFGCFDQWFVPSFDYDV